MSVTSETGFLGHNPQEGLPGTFVFWYRVTGPYIPEDATFPTTTDYSPTTLQKLIQEKERYRES